ncbi:hypothetical protein [Rhizobium sp. SGZ-381]|uniref:hypothetical protein n=1 Tax=Rhizobium sp. SGZ-381 TaxID=3342800 RepID=UPI00366F9179
MKLLKPVASPERTLSDFKLPQMQIVCSNCGRKGCYALSRLVARCGADMPIRAFIEHVSADCPQRKTGRCRAGCDDLVGMWVGAPFTDQWTGN